MSNQLTDVGREEECVGDDSQCVYVRREYRGTLFISLAKCVSMVLLQNGGSWKACAIKLCTTLLCVPKQSMRQNGVVP